MRTALAALLLLIPTAARAQSGVDATAAALVDAGTRGCVQLEAGALAVRVGLELGADAPDPAGLTPAVVGPMLAALRADARFSAVHLASFGRDDVEPAVQARSLGYAALLDLLVRRDGDALVLEGGVWRTRDAVRLGSFSRRVPLDGSLRRFVGFPPLLADDAIRARSMRLPGAGYVALAVADLDQDGRPELVLASPREVQVFRVEGARLALVGRAPIPAATPHSPSPPRRIVGSARAAADVVHVRISDHAAGLVVRLVGGAPRVELAEGPCEADRFPMMGGCARLVTGRDFFDQELTQHAAPVSEAAAHFYTYTFGRYEARDGAPASYEAIVMPSGRLSLRVRRELAREGAEPEIEERAAAAVGYGTALAMSDLDLDGTAELLASHAAPAGTGDQLSLLRADARGVLRVMWRSEPVPGSVWVASAGDLDGDGAPELLAIEEPAGQGRAELWIVR